MIFTDVARERVDLRGAPYDPRNGSVCPSPAPAAMPNSWPPRTGRRSLAPSATAEGGERFGATTVNALAIDGSTAWLAGVGRDRRNFVA